MKRIQTALKLIAALAIATFATHCATTDNSQIAGNLALNAGFHTVTPNTPAQKATFAKLPAGKVSALTHNGKKFYIIPNLAKNQAYVGGPKQYQRYQELQAGNKIGAANVEAIELYGTGYDNMGAGSLAAWDGWGEGVALAR